MQWAAKFSRMPKPQTSHLAAVAALLFALSACTKVRIDCGPLGTNDDEVPATADGSTLFDASRVAALALEVTDEDLAFLCADADQPMGFEDLT